MCYVGVEYECSRDISLQFETKEALKAPSPEGPGLVLMRMKPDQDTGIHGLALKGCGLQTPVAPDTEKIPAELFCYFEKAGEWEETV